MMIKTNANQKLRRNIKKILEEHGFREGKLVEIILTANVDFERVNSKGFYFVSPRLHEENSSRIKIKSGYIKKMDDEKFFLSQDSNVKKPFDLGNYYFYDTIFVYKIKDSII